MCGCIFPSLHLFEDIGKICYADTEYIVFFYVNLNLNNFHCMSEYWNIQKYILDCSLCINSWGNSAEYWFVLAKNISNPHGGNGAHNWPDIYINIKSMAAKETKGVIEFIGAPLFLKMLYLMSNILTSTNHHRREGTSGKSMLGLQHIYGHSSATCSKRNRFYICSAFWPMVSLCMLYNFFRLV